MKVQYIYTLNIPDDKVPDLQHSAEQVLCKEVGHGERMLISHLMSQVIDQLKQISEKNVGSHDACAVLIQHCCVIGMAVASDYSVRFRVLPDDSEKPFQVNKIIWN